MPIEPDSPDNTFIREGFLSKLFRILLSRRDLKTEERDGSDGEYGNEYSDDISNDGSDISEIYLRKIKEDETPRRYKYSQFQELGIFIQVFFLILKTFSNYCFFLVNLCKSGDLLDNSRYLYKKYAIDIENKILFWLIFYFIFQDCRLQWVGGRYNRRKLTKSNYLMRTLCS